jgi:DNA-binding transcriptional LysR family regulator
MHDLNWDDLRYFLAVARSGSVSGAARQLRVNHSTVIRRLAALEARLEARLFDRSRDGYALTGAGEDLDARLRPVAEQIESLERQLGGLDAVLKGAIRVTSTDTLVNGPLTPSLAAFRRLHPAIHLQVTINNTFLNLTKREADVAVRPSNTPPENLVGRPVGVIQTAVYASKEYLRRAAKAGLRRTDWSKHTWVALDETLDHLAQARWVAAQAPPERIALRVDSLVGMARAVREGIGVGMLLCLLAEPERGLVRLAPPPPELDTQVWVLTHPDLRRVQRIKALTDHLYDTLRRDPFIAPLPRGPR